MFLNFDGTQLFYFFLAMLIGMSLHEAMHAFVGHWLGDDTARLEGRLTLNPLKHIDIFTTVLIPVVMVLLRLPPIFAAKPVPFNSARVKYDEFGAALIGVSGPLTNLALACVGGLVFRSGLVTSNSLSDFVVIFTLTNVSLFVFNMIPFPPLDGSRILYAFAPEPLQRLMRQIESFGVFGIVIFMLIIFQFISPLLIKSIDGLFTLIVGSPLSI